MQEAKPHRRLVLERRVWPQRQLAKQKGKRSEFGEGAFVLARSLEARSAYFGRRCENES